MVKKSVGWPFHVIMREETLENTLSRRTHSDVLLSWVQPLAILCTKYMPSSAASARTHLMAATCEWVGACCVPLFVLIMKHCNACREPYNGPCCI